MARLFDITTTSDTASTAPAGTVRLVFTVTNTTQRPLRGSLRAKALDSGQAGWLKIEGEAERDFPPGGAQQVEVNAKVPAGTAASKFRVRLDALSVANPDDDFTEGPAVSVTVTGASEEKKSGGIPWWVWVIIGVVVLAIIGVVLWLVLRPNGDPVVPETPPAASAPVVSERVIPEALTGKPFAEAKRALEALGLVVAQENVNVFDDCPGKVTKTAPPAGASVTSGASVTVSVTALAYGRDTCKQGFVWREAVAGDHVCVTPETHAQAIVDNGAQAERTERAAATSKDFDDLQKEHPEAKAVAKGDFTALQSIIGRQRLITEVARPGVFFVLRCKVQYTERRATANDRACVTRTTQIATDADNGAADSRKVCPRP
jgi:hypothetical protein